jgi:hypothetical protein
MSVESVFWIPNRLLNRFLQRYERSSSSRGCSFSLLLSRKLQHRACNQSRSRLTFDSLHNVTRIRCNCIGCFLRPSNKPQFLPTTVSDLHQMRLLRTASEPSRHMTSHGFTYAFQPITPTNRQVFFANTDSLNEPPIIFEFEKQHSTRRSTSARAKTIAITTSAAVSRKPLARTHTFPSSSLSARQSRFVER